MLDANQAWDLATARHMADRLREVAPARLEEPLRADRPVSEWQQLAHSTPIPLAAGKSLIGTDAFDSMIGSGALGVVQPDLAKWGGISGCLPVIERIHAAGLRYCPHFLGASIGQLASAHLLAAPGEIELKCIHREKTGEFAGEHSVLFPGFRLVPPPTGLQADQVPGGTHPFDRHHRQPGTISRTSSKCLPIKHK